MNRWILTADLHFTDSPKDRYRFGIFDWLAKRQSDLESDAVFILGDLTDKKDNHSSCLVNNVVEGIRKIRPPVYILRGNHDGIDPNNPFFRFLSAIPGVFFVMTPTQVGSVYMIPYCETQEKFNEAAKHTRPDHYVMLHQCLEGAIAETGGRLTGISAALVEQRRPRAIWAGDIHRPQTVGAVTYVGAPYHIRFGDPYIPRALIYDVGYNNADNLYFPAPLKWSLTLKDPSDLKRYQIKKGDQAKITLELAREEAVEWPIWRQRVLEACNETGLEVYGLQLSILTNAKRERKRIVEHKPKDHADTLLQFCRAENVAANIQKVGLELVNVPG